MRIIADDLCGVLAEMCDLCFKGLQLILICDFVEINAVLIGEGIEDIHVLDCIFASLLVAVDQVDPLVNVL